MEKFLPIPGRRRTIIGTVASVSFLPPAIQCEEIYVDIKTEKHQGNFYSLKRTLHCLPRTNGSPLTRVCFSFLWNRWCFSKLTWPNQTSHVTYSVEGQPLNYWKHSDNRYWLIDKRMTWRKEVFSLFNEQKMIYWWEIFIFPWKWWKIPHIGNHLWWKDESSLWTAKHAFGSAVQFLFLICLHIVQTSRSVRSSFNDSSRSIYTYWWGKRKASENEVSVSLCLLFLLLLCLLDVWKARQPCCWDIIKRKTIWSSCKREWEWRRRNSMISKWWVNEILK